MASGIAAKSSSPLQISSLMAQAMLRILAVAFTLAAISVLVTSTQSVLIFGIDFVASYSYTSACRFLLGVNITACTFSVLSLIFVCILSRSGSHPRKCFFLFLHDMVIMVLLISGCAAATAIGYVSRYGEEKVGWMAVCENVSRFCNRVMISLVLSYLAFFSYLALTIMSANKLMSRTD